MSDSADDTPTDDVSNESDTDALITQVTSTYKILGQFSADNGVGVLGQNDASSGTPIGVQGAVPNATSNGYGISTPHDARVLGVAELNALAGNLTGGDEVSNLAGDGISIDGSGNLNWTKTYETNTFTASGTSWNAISGLSSETPIEVTIDTSQQTSGRLRLLVDGSLDDVAKTGDVLHRIVGPSSSVTLSSEEYFSQAKSFDVSNQTSNAQGLAFKDDGMKMFVLSTNGNAIFSYSLSSSWDIGTASPTGNSLGVSNEDTNAFSITFKDDGTKMFMVGDENVNIYSYNLSSAWDLTSASFNRSFDVDSETLGPRGLTFKDDGSQLYVTEDAATIYVYGLNTAWDLSTASYSGTSVTFQNQFRRGYDVQFTSNGSKMFVADFTEADIYEYNLSTQWDVTSATLVDVLDVSNEVGRVADHAFKTDGSKMILADGFETVYQYNTAYNGTVYASVEAD